MVSGALFFASGKNILSLIKQFFRMKDPIISLLFFSVLFFSSCCHHKKVTTPPDVPISSQNEPRDVLLDFEAYYYHSTESSYEEIKIKEGKIYFTYFKDEKGTHSQWIDQKPYWNKSELPTKEASLSAQEIDSLSEKIDQYGFWKLDTLIGNPAATERYYVFELSFKTSSNKKDVLFKSVPGGVSMPSSFMRSRDELMRMARKKTGY
jgi:hypothetical protein